MAQIYPLIYVQFGSRKQKLRPWRTVPDAGLLQGSPHAGVQIKDFGKASDGRRIVGITVNRLRKEVQFPIPGSAMASRNGATLSDNDIVVPGDLIELFSQGEAKKMRSSLHKEGEASGKAKSKSKTSVKPRWDDETRSLWVGDKLIKQLIKAAPYQELVFRAFQELKWRKRIDDPLPAGKRVQTIDGLNRNHKTQGIIRFGNDGTGKGIKWFFVTQ
jgi:hypothetical protein